LPFKIHLRMKKFKFPSGDKSLSLLALFISVATLLLFSYQTKLMKKQAYASVLPYLEIWYNRPDSLNFSFNIVNSGIGPAFIRDYYIQYKDSTYQMDPATFLNQVILEKDTIQFAYSNLRKGRLVPAGQTIFLVSAAGTEKDALKLFELFSQEKIKLVLHYSSIYDETWRVDGMMAQPVRTD
jgi:hypothetical protein